MGNQESFSDSNVAGKTNTESNQDLVDRKSVAESFPPNHGFNFGLTTVYYVLMRVGWIFKTESIIMPAVLDLIGGQGWLRGCLPMLNRFGQSIPPLLISDWLRNTKIKKWALSASAFVMGACFLALSLIWWITGGAKSWWLPIAFLVIYAVFFASTGIHQLIFSTLNGKLIATRRRGRLMLISSTLGAFCACLLAWILLTRWLSEEVGNFTAIFAFTGGMLVLASGLTLFLKEDADVPSGTKRTSLDLFKMSAAALIVDKNFRQLAIIAGLFGMSMTLFPHYQALARGGSKLGLTALIPWVIAQNIGASLFSIPAGWAGDKFGYRTVLRTLMFAICVAPVFALVLARYGKEAESLYILVFSLVGLTPISIRAFNNYTLEIVVQKYHPRYLATLSLCMAAPAIFTSSLVGAGIDWLGFEPVFVVVVLMIFVGGVMTFWLAEPRETGVRESLTV